MLLVGFSSGPANPCARTPSPRGSALSKLPASPKEARGNRLVPGTLAALTALGLKRRHRSGTFVFSAQCSRHVRHASTDDAPSHEVFHAPIQPSSGHASKASTAGSNLEASAGSKAASPAEAGINWDPTQVHWSRRVVATALGALTASVSTRGPTPMVIEDAAAEAELSNEVERSPIDMRDYKAITLDNGLRVLLISDKDTDRAAAALDVHAGYYCDPDDLPGLAHFCEHMLFLGTDEFPEENSYDAFITESGGSSNAFTDGQDTVYYFTVGAPSLMEALQRFSSFFKTPRFDRSATEREIRAIDSEHEKNLQDDAFRMGQLVQTLANPQNPYHHFGTGTRATLLDEPMKKGKDTRQELLAYYDRYYVAPLMTLCIVGRQSLPELQNMAEAFFGPIRGSDGQRSQLPQPLLVPALGSTPFQQRAFGIEMQVVPVGDVRTMELLFPVRFKQREGKQAGGALFLDEYRRYNPAQHISGAIGYEGRKSLCASLRKQGLVTALNAGNYDENEAFSVFSVQIELTKEGFEKRDAVLDQVFGYINFLRTEGCPKELLQENITLSEANWRCLERAPAGDTCVALARNMHRVREPRRFVSSALRLSDGPGLQDAVDACLSQLTPSNALLFTNSRDFDASATEREKWYGTRYAERDLKSLKRRWQVMGCPLGLDFPPPNPFLPRSLELKAPWVGFRRVGEVDPPPETRRNDQYWQSYFRQDTEFGVPKAYAIVELLTPLPRSSAKAAVMCRLYEALLIDSLTETLLYDAHTAGLYFNLTTSPRGVRFFFGGYDDRLLDFTRVALKSTIEFDVTRDKARAAAQFDILERELRSFSSQAPWKQANYWATLASQTPDYTILNLIEAFKTVTVEDIREFSQALWTKSPLYGLAYSQGNLLPSEADRLVAMVSDILDFKALPESQWPKPEVLKLPISPAGSWGAVSVQPAMDPEEENSACQILYQIGSARKGSGEAGARLCAASEVFSALIRDRFYSELRTQQQLGYIVFSLVNRREGIITFSLTVQGTAVDPLGVVSRIDDFLEAQRAYLQGLSEDAVTRVAVALAEAKLARPQQLAEAVELRWREIASRDFIWDRPTREASMLRLVGKDDVLGMYERYVADGATERRRFVSLVFGAVHRSEYEAAASKVRGSLVNEVSAFSSSLKKWP
mmetsp:Transcript_62477/g.116087  ORF Transcript_62477/g.116087 Transcript_62477/m.116087 type:complete len:1156 (+) Transcript_62477:56-3523(+)